MRHLLASTLVVASVACSNELPLELDAGPDASIVACGALPAVVDSTWSGGSLLYCGSGREPCGASATTTGPCWCVQEWATDSTGERCGGAVVSPDGEHVYRASCDPQTGICRCEIDGEECFCRARPARSCSEVCGADPRGCGCGDLPDGTPGAWCAETCQTTGPLTQCCAEASFAGACICGNRPADICERSLNCCWTGGYAASP